MGGILNHVKQDSKHPSPLPYVVLGQTFDKHRRPVEANAVCLCRGYNSRQISPTEEVQSPQVLSNPKCLYPEQISHQAAVLGSRDRGENYSTLPHRLLCFCSSTETRSRVCLVIFCPTRATRPGQSQEVLSIREEELNITQLSEEEMKLQVREDPTVLFLAQPERHFNLLPTQPCVQQEQPEAQ